MPLKKPTFSIEHQYQLYLKRVALSEGNMHQQQRIQLRQTFFGAVGQILFLFRDELTQLSEEDSVATMEDMKNQVLEFFTTQTRGGN